ncbi:hypothetical protein FH972_024218 [Carpinus fangiana]|uniref:DUF7924 domain-containing protein n=1 Tax=Carpinus fangiana TaxID=176857 RepID=A0A5N6KXU8_9ROSI|nr:hypothetical protein FH972_024218 [Carpinus fangiana]
MTSATMVSSQTILRFKRHEINLWSKISQADRDSSIADGQHKFDIDGSSAWPATGWAQIHWTTVLRPECLELVKEIQLKVCGQRKFQVVFNCSMIGMEPKIALPTVVVIHPDSGPRKRFIGALRQNELFQHSGFEIRSTNGPVIKTATAGETMSDTFYGLSGNDESQQHDTNFMPPSLLGKTFKCLNSTGRQATLAAIVRVYGQDYGLTVAHCFESLDESEDSAIIPPEPVVLDSAAEDLQQYFAKEYGKNELPETSVGIAPLNRHEYYSLTSDWALVKPLKKQCFFNRLPDSLSIDSLHESKEAPTGSVFVINEDECSYRRTDSYGATSLLALPGVLSPQVVFCIQTTTADVEPEARKQLRSGSLVINEHGAVFGMVVAASPEMNLTYVMPISTIFDQISVSLHISTHPGVERACFAPVLRDQRVDSEFSSHEFLRRALMPFWNDHTQTASFREVQPLTDKLSRIFRQAVNKEWHNVQKLAEGEWLRALVLKLEMVCSFERDASNVMVDDLFVTLQAFIGHWDKAFHPTENVQELISRNERFHNLQQIARSRSSSLQSDLETDSQSTNLSLDRFGSASSLKPPAPQIRTSSILQSEKLKATGRRVYKGSVKDLELILEDRGLTLTPSLRTDPVTLEILKAMSTRRKINMENFQKIRELMQYFLTTTNKSTTSEENHESFERFQERLSEILPECASYAITENDFHRNRARLSHCIPGSLARNSILLTLVDQRQLENSVFTAEMDCRWANQGQYTLLDLPRPQPHLAVSFRSDYIFDRFHLGIPDRISAPYVSCIHPDLVMSRCFPFFFMQVGKGEAGLHQANLKTMAAASQALFNIYTWTKAAKDTSLFKDVRVFTLSQNGDMFNLRVHRASIVNSQDLRFEFDEINSETHHHYTQQNLGTAIRTILNEYASSKLSKILMTAADNFFNFTINKEFGLDEVGQRLMVKADDVAADNSNVTDEGRLRSQAATTGRSRKRHHSQSSIFVESDKRRTERQASARGRTRHDIDSDA